MKSAVAIILLALAVAATAQSSYRDDHKKPVYCDHKDYKDECPKWYECVPLKEPYCEKHGYEDTCYYSVCEEQIVYCDPHAKYGKDECEEKFGYEKECEAFGYGKEECTYKEKCDKKQGKCKEYKYEKDPHSCRYVDTHRCKDYYQVEKCDDAKCEYYDDYGKCKKYGEKKCYYEKGKCKEYYQEEKCDEKKVCKYYDYYDDCHKVKDVCYKGKCVEKKHAPQPHRKHSPKPHGTYDPPRYG